MSFAARALARAASLAAFALLFGCADEHAVTTTESPSGAVASSSPASSASEHVFASPPKTAATPPPSVTPLETRKLGEILKPAKSARVVAGKSPTASFTDDKEIAALVAAVGADQIPTKTQVECSDGPGYALLFQDDKGEAIARLSFCNPQSGKADERTNGHLDFTHTSYGIVVEDYAAYRKLVAKLGMQLP